MHKPPYIYEITWLPMKGITLYPFVFIRDKKNRKVKRHEDDHVDDIKAEGWYIFYPKWFYYTIRYGYWNNPYEVKARKNSRRKNKT